MTLAALVALDQQRERGAAVDLDEARRKCGEAALEVASADEVSLEDEARTSGDRLLRERCEDLVRADAKPLRPLEVTGPEPSEQCFLDGVLREERQPQPLCDFPRDGRLPRCRRSLHDNKKRHVSVGHLAEYLEDEDDGEEE